MPAGRNIDPEPASSPGEFTFGLPKGTSRIQGRAFDQNGVQLGLGDVCEGQDQPIQVNHLGAGNAGAARALGGHETQGDPLGRIHGRSLTRI